MPPRQPPPRKKKALGDVLSGPVRAAIFSTPARAVQNLQDVAKNTPIGIAVQRAMSGAQTFRNEGYVSAVKQQAKTAAIDIASAAAGAGVGKVGRAVAKTGIPQLVANKVRGQTVLVHGTGNAIEGNVLRPVGGSPASPNQKVVFGWNPREKGSKYFVPNNVQEYAAGKTNSFVSPQYNVVIGKTRTRNIIRDPENPAILKSTKPVKIQSVVKSNVPYQTFEKNLGDALKKSGAPLRGSSAYGPAVDRINKIRRQVKSNRVNKKSVM